MDPQVATVDLPRDGELSFWNGLDLGYEDGTSVAFKLLIQSQVSHGRQRSLAMHSIRR